MSMSPDEGDLSDAISMTSTLVSDEDQEFEVERILAEREVSDEEGEDSTRYLVQWTGYPAHRHSWEPATAFNSKETLQSWGARKREIASGKRKPFDVRSWEVHCKHVAAETKKRKAKRKRLRDFKSRQAKKTGAPAKTNSNLVDVDRRKSRRRSSVDSVASSALFVPENHTPPSLENTASTQFREQQDNQHPAAPPLRASSGRFVSVNKPFPPGETNSPQSLEKQNSEPSATASKQKATRESAPQLARAAAANSRNSRKSTSAPSAGPANTESEQPAGSHKQKQRQTTLSTGSKNTTIKKPALAEFGPPRERREARQHRWSERSMPLASAIDPKKPSEYAPRTMMSDGTPAMLQADSSPTSEQTQHQLSSELQTSIVGPPRPSDEASNIAAPQSAGQEVPLPTPVPTTASAVSQSLNLAQNSLGSSPALSLANSETNIDEIFNPRGSLSPIDPLGISVEGTTETDLIQTTEPDSNMAPHPPIPTRPRVSIETANLTEKESLPDTRDTGRRFGPFTLESHAPSVDVPHPSDYSVQSPFDRRSPPRRGSPVRHRSPGRRRSPPGGTYWPRRRSFSRDRSFSRSPERRPFFARRSPSPRYSTPPRRDSYRWASPPRESTQRRVPKGGDSYRPGSDRRSIASGNPRSANLRHFSSASDLAPAPTEPKAMRDGSSKTSARALEEARIAALIAQMPIRSPPRGAITAPGGYWWDRDNDELLVHVFFGPMRRKIGPLRLCGMGRFVKLDLIRIGKSPNSPEFEVWFKDVCTVEEFDRLRDPNVSVHPHDLSI
ncbi:Chromo domain/shadow [Penicillium brevicompactum]|uniref:Chromo domain/shadow n=1 Tax=Penicillium brevicompactum TaxID=5074 RepID=A0A9W9UDI9_PENBR|nr:Chromo domain/shadow [Penicillium brevicompactum]